MRSPLHDAMRSIIPHPTVNRGRSLLSSSSAQRHHVPISLFSAYAPIPILSISTLRHFHGARLAAFQLAELTFVDEPVRTGIAHATGPNQNIGLGFDDCKGMIAAGSSHAGHRVKGSKDGACVVGVLLVIVSCW